MNHKLFKERIDDILKEVDVLRSGKFSDDKLLIFMHELLVKCEGNNYVTSETDLNNLRNLGLATLRAFDTHDYVPEARKLLDLTSILSRELESTD